MSDKKDVKKAIQELKDELYIELLNKVAKKLIEESNKQQKQTSEELVKRLENWDIMVQEEIKKKVEQEWKLRNGQPDN